MKLLLTSGGLTNKSIIAALQKLVGKPFSETKLVFIPTAANAEIGDKWWLIDDLVNCKKLGFAEVDIVDIAALEQDMWEPRLRGADVLMVGGGNTSYLMKHIRESGLEKLLPTLLETKVYIGLSAGSIVASPYLSLGVVDELYEDDHVPHESERGMGFVSFRIAPHFNSPHFPKYSEKNLSQVSNKIQNTMYALDDQSAIKVVDGEVEVISEGTWKKFN